MSTSFKYKYFSKLSPAVIICNNQQPMLAEGQTDKFQGMQYLETSVDDKGKLFQESHSSNFLRNVTNNFN